MGLGHTVRGNETPWPRFTLKAVDLKELRQRIERLDDAFALWAQKSALR